VVLAFAVAVILKLAVPAHAQEQPPVIITSVSPTEGKPGIEIHIHAESTSGTVTISGASFEDIFVPLAEPIQCGGTGEGGCTFTVRVPDTLDTTSGDAGLVCVRAVIGPELYSDCGSFQVR
jgi:hypothetical protein